MYLCNFANQHFALRFKVGFFVGGLGAVCVGCGGGAVVVDILEGGSETGKGCGYRVA
jgi:hypothetical protein